MYSLMQILLSFKTQLAPWQVDSPEEDVVTLVVKRDSSPALEVGILTEDGGKHAAQSMSQTSPKIVQN